MDGLLNVNKPPGLTSFAVVRLVREMSGEKRVGHTGTLDPSAQGVLVLCLGRATKISGYLLGSDKEYLATIKLGETTDTDDADGTLLSRCSLPQLGREGFERILRDFAGEIDQVPPAFSAVKMGGRRLYEAARKGERVTPKARRVEIKEIQLVSLNAPLLGIRVVCSKGTYIRSLARDIGERLGCGGHLLSLVRTRVGDFRIEDAAELGQLDTAVGVEERLLPAQAALKGHPQLVVGKAALRKIAHGMGIGKGAVEGALDLADGRVVLLEDGSGRICALARIDGSLIKPFKVLI